MKWEKLKENVLWLQMNASINKLSFHICLKHFDKMLHCWYDNLNKYYNISIYIAPFARGYKALLPIDQENRHSHFASPKGATGQVHTLSELGL